MILFHQLNQQPINDDPGALFLLLIHHYFIILLIIRIVMRKAAERFFDWIFHPSVRRETLPRGKALLYRYPSPGSILPDSTPRDYRTPFSNTPYNVRVSQLTHAQTAGGTSNVRITSIDTNQKLILLGFLSEKDVENKSAVEEASKNFQSKYGFPIESHVFQNDLKVSIPDLNDRESYKEAIATQFISNKIHHENSCLVDEEDSNNNMNVMNFQSLDLFDAPHFQQSRIQNAYALDQLANSRANTPGGIDVRKGEAKFWKALDDSNEPENVKQVQEKIGDSDPNNFDFRNGKIVFDFDKDGNVVDIHRKQ